MSTYQEIADELVKTEQVEVGKWFGRPCLKTNSYVFAALWQEEYIVLKLTDDTHARALALSGAELFDPSGRKRPMREWVQIPAEHEGQWRELALASLAYIRSLPPKKPKKKK